MRNLRDMPCESFLRARLKNGVKLVVGLSFCVAAISLSAIAAPSNLDPTFGTLGKVISGPDGTPTFTASGMALAPDGKILMVGNRVQNNQYVGIFVARYNANGSLDTSFGAGGFASVVFGNDFELSEDIALQADGKVVIGARMRKLVNNFPFWDFAIARFTADGLLDTSFDGDGKAIVDFENLIPGYQEHLSSVKVTADGKIVAAGLAIFSGIGDRFVLAKLNSDGTPDTSFGANGKKADVERGSNQDAMNDMVALPDGSVVLVGFHYGLSGNYRIASKFTVTGTKEWEYIAGVFGNPPPPRHHTLSAIAALPNGKFIVVGKRDNRIVAIRLNANGTEDNTFLNPAMPFGEPLSVAIQADGKILVTLSGGDFSLVRYNSDGSLDTSFGGGGFFTTSVTDGGDYSTEVLVQPDGKILIGGTSQPGTPTQYYVSMVRYLGAAATRSPLFDYDGDGRADVSVFRPSQNRWYILRSSVPGVTEQTFAIPGDVPTPADYDGDGRTDISIYRPSSADWWYLSSINGAQITARWGQPGVIPRPSDFDGDGKADFIVYLPSNSTWYRWGSTVGESNVTFGIAEDKPVTGDFDGDGKSDVAVYRPSTGEWWYAASSLGGAHRAARWGIASDIPAPADYDGDGKTDFAVYRPSTGVWYIVNSSDGSYTIAGFGLSEDKPVPADYDGDGKADIAVFRPSSGVWYMTGTTSGFSALQFGISTDIPTANSFVP